MSLTSRKGWLPYRWIQVLLLWLFCQGGVSAYASSTEAVDQLKAAYLYNIAKLVSWPDDILGDNDHLIFCAVASDEFTQLLRKATARPLSGRRTKVVVLNSRSPSHFCHVVFVDQQHTQSWFKYNHAPQRGQLVVGESPQFTNKGGIINFYLAGEKLRFEINVEHARESQLKISSRLLRLAKIVEGGP